MSKGSSYERTICKQLSSWWTDGKREDVFWRTAGSGARAKARNKMGKSTFGQYGDICADDPIGQPLMDLCVIEVKRGYSGETFANLIESHQNPKVQKCMFQRFLDQAEEEREMAKVPYWMLITKRDGRTPILTIPWCLYAQKEIIDIIPKTKMEIEYAVMGNSLYDTIIICRLEDFLHCVNPAMLIKISKRKTLRSKTRGVRS